MGISISAVGSTPHVSSGADGSSSSAESGIIAGDVDSLQAAPQPNVGQLEEFAQGTEPLPSASTAQTGALTPSTGQAAPDPQPGSAPPALPRTAYLTRIDSERKIENEVTGLEQSFRSKALGRDADDGAAITVTPQNSGGSAEFGSKTHVFFVNGIQTDSARASAEATMLASRMHQPVTLIYVKKGSLTQDLNNCVSETFDPDHGRRNPPERALSAHIISTIDAGQNAHIVGFSRGALVTQLAIDDVRRHYEALGHDDAWIKMNIMPKITVETFNGASHHMPDGVRAKHYVGDTDYLVGQTIGMGPHTPVIRFGAATAIDAVANPVESLLAKANDLPPSQRRAAMSDFKALLHDTETLTHDTLSTNPSTLATTLDGKLPGDTIRVSNDLTRLRTDVSTPATVGPGAAELRRDGYGNTPNGPIVRVPVYHDLPHSFSPMWFIDQHDFPAMMISRQPFNQGM